MLTVMHAVFALQALSCVRRTAPSYNTKYRNVLLKEVEVNFDATVKPHSSGSSATFRY